MTSNKMTYQFRVDLLEIESSINLLPSGALTPPQPPQYFLSFGWKVSTVIGFNRTGL